MTPDNKELLITDEKRRVLGKPAIYPMEDFVLADQVILTSEFLTDEMESRVRECIEDGCFIVLNEKAVNAYAYSREGYNVVALTFGSIYNSIYFADLFMLSEDYFPEIGDENASYSDVTTKKFPQIIRDNGEISFTVSGDDERRNCGYMIALLAIKYMVYHEIGHHACGHLQKYSEVLGLDSGELGKTIHTCLSPDELKKIETEADVYAVHKLVGEFDELLEKWNPYFEVPLGHLEMALLLITALVIVKENLNEEILSLEEIDESGYPPAIVRLSISLHKISRTDKQIIEEYRKALILNAEYEEHAGLVEEFRNLNEERLRDMLTEYLSNVVVSFEQIYADISLGRHDQAVFQSEFLAYEWWKNLQ